MGVPGSSRKNELSWCQGLLPAAAGRLQQGHVLEHHEVVLADQPADQGQQPLGFRDRPQPRVVGREVHELAHQVHPLLTGQPLQTVRGPRLVLHDGAPGLLQQRREPVEGAADRGRGQQRRNSEDALETFLPADEDSAALLREPAATRPLGCRGGQ
ncbi:hypothetical protein [Pseudonocardia kunmingensis]|uniref:hypothetical protein n=1 Tax=Pseudonocardia kunmingensis TaxID=630975 RepID=UPI00114FCD86|nr:hypothetical protein [Pseudonocardia kunmingensis]